MASLFWCQFLNGFSGIAMTDHWSLILFNLLFTSVPPIIYGVMDKDISANILLRMPELYKASQRSEVLFGLAKVPDSLVLPVPH